MWIGIRHMPIRHMWIGIRHMPIGHMSITHTGHIGETHG